MSLLYSTLIPILFAISTVLLAQHVNNLILLPYIDEIFHVPQARTFCNGDYASYDVKLTTPPGLYLLSLLLGRILPGVECKDLGFLRSTNLVMVLCMPHLMAAILEESEDERERRIIRRGEGGMERQIPPPYTREDQGASARTLGRIDTPNHTIPGRRRGGISRSTITALQQKAKASPIDTVILSSPANQQSLRSRRTHPYRITLGHTLTLIPPFYFFTFLYYTDVGSVFFVLLTLYSVQKRRGVLAALFSVISLLFRQTNIVWTLFLVASQLAGEVGVDSLTQVGKVWSRRGLVIKRVAPFLPIFVAFGYFITMNGGIVLGDKTNHQASMHTPQLFYFLLFATFFGWPALLSHFCRLRWSHVLLSIVLVTPLASWAVTKQTYTHPFLLSDNRHYTFYLWRYTILRHPYLKFALIPVYLLTFAAWLGAVDQTQVWKFGFLTALMITVVPAPLVEPRYFLTSYILLRLSLWRVSRRWLALEASWHLLINLITIYVFLYKPFSWPANGVDTLRGESTIMRFMW